jgi:ArsR family transcriptional regulator
LKVNYSKEAQVLKAIAHPTRLMIIEKLLKEKQCVCNIEEKIGKRQPNISQHLTILRLNGIVDYRQEGRRKCYFLRNSKELKKIIKSLKRCL